ncbi:DUF6319 family protein [Amycolatopsis sp. NPDC059021]|uniref:DUF6319 family protein n=1 Tax=Amycolatopsis sp. NPDC059021 TaxID=3346704 RepID=UPI00366B7983
MTVDVLTHEEEPATADAAAAPASQPADTSKTENDTTETGSPAADTAEKTEAADEKPAEEPKPKRGRPKAQTTAKKTRTVELILTVTGTADGEWQAELKNGSKWVAKGLEIPAAAVSRAAKELHQDLSGPIDEVINAAREAQAAKVAQLEAELERAKQALAELDS